MKTRVISEVKTTTIQIDLTQLEINALQSAVLDSPIGKTIVFNLCLAIVDSIHCEKGFVSD